VNEQEKFEEEDKKEQIKKTKQKDSHHYFFLPQIDLALDRPATLGSLESFSLPD